MISVPDDTEMTKQLAIDIFEEADEMDLVEWDGWINDLLCKDYRFRELSHEQRVKYFEREANIIQKQIDELNLKRENLVETLSYAWEPKSE